MEFAGDNFVRISGDTVSHAKSQMFSWEAGAKGLDVHALAEPTKLEALKKEYEAKKTGFKSDAKQGRRVLHLVDHQALSKGLITWIIKPNPVKSYLPYDI